METPWTIKKLLKGAALELREFAKEAVVQVLHEQAEKIKASTNKPKEPRRKRVSNRK
jgi:hypothetical protein